MHIVPMELPNRKLPIPPPFVHHPELFPELAHRNPSPTNLPIPSKKKGKRNKLALKASAVSQEDVHRVEVPKWMDENKFRENFEQYAWKQPEYSMKEEDLQI